MKFYPSNRGFVCELSEDSQEVTIFDFSEHKLIRMPTVGTKGLEIGEFVKTDGKKPVRFDVNEISSDGGEIIVDGNMVFVEKVIAFCPTTKSLAKDLRATYANKVIVQYSPNEDLGTVFDVKEVIDSPSRYKEELKKAEAAAAKKLEDAKRRTEAVAAKKVEASKKRAEAKKNQGNKVAPVKRGVQKKEKIRVLTRAQAAKAAAESAQKC